MKYFSFILFTVFFSISVLSQNDVIVNRNEFLKEGSFIRNPPNELKGSPYLFEKWNNNNFVHLINNKEKKAFKIKNINIHISLNKFVTKIKNDDIFSFDQDYFDYVIINNRRFEFFYFPKTNNKRLFEIIGKFDNNILLKGYSTFISKGEVKGYQTSPPVDRIKIKTTYFIKKGSNFIRIKIKKKNIILLFKDRKTKIIDFSKKEKLSFKKDKDIIKIIAFYNTLK